MENMTALNNQLKQLNQNQQDPNLQGISQAIDQLSTQATNGSVDQMRENLAKIQASLQGSIQNLEGQQGTEQLTEQLNQLQVELMNLSQGLEHQALNQTQTETIPGQPYEGDNDPEPGAPLS
ncbi:hypothetical protein [Ammoniphilus resinae]|uniref:PurR-regulated permease PerM n=1 Tax=Ammoniphilus resinae TaxID=861532 RepID=A0ABS4GL48_9BACL|nr:hypothetical protein [Ammoniphilus resinae]MBP1930949.1 putative PurR-regulated permease PerM [Ammoniphilus resinae]